jgi:hypothetical protein
LKYLQPSFYYIAAAFHPKSSYRSPNNPYNLLHHQTLSGHQRTHPNVAAATSECDADVARTVSALAAKVPAD